MTKPFDNRTEIQRENNSSTSELQSTNKNDHANMVSLIIEGP